MEDKNIKNIVSKAINKDKYKDLSYEKRIEKFLQESSLFSDDYFYNIYAGRRKQK